MTNKPVFQDIMDAALQLGAEAGKGKDTQVRFLLKIIEGGYHNILDLEHNKHGADKDDATMLAEAYVKAQQGTTVFDAKAPNQRKLISCLRTGIKLGSWPKGGSGEPIVTVNALLSERQKLREDPVISKKLNDATNTILNFAREQLKRDMLIDPSEFNHFLFKPDRDELSAEEIIERVVKKLTTVIDGGASHGTACDNSATILDARDMLRKRLSEYAAARAPQM